jgi:hypothetical protein
LSAASVAAAIFVNRAGNRDKHVKAVPDSTLVWLAALGAGNSLKDHLQTIRDRIRVHIHVYEIKAAELPAIGSQDTVDEQTRLSEKLKAIVMFPLPRLPPPPLPYRTAQPTLPRQPKPRR